MNGVASYVVHEKLGEGAMGAVYRATHRVTGQHVALKRVRSWEHGIQGISQAEQALMGEFQILSALHHPNVINVLDYGLDSDRQPYFAMELLHTPRSLLEAGANKSVEERVELLVQVLRALTYLHRSAVLHRDLKPSNVLVQNDVVKVVDFGVAAGQSNDRGVRGGTLAYLAPEFFCGGERSVAADLYAFGLVAFELLHGHYPFDLSDSKAFLEQLIGQSFVGGRWHAEVPNALVTLATVPAHAEDFSLFAGITLQGSLIVPEGPFGSILAKLLARNPKERYADPRQVIQDLGRVLGKNLAVESTATRESLLRAARFVGRSGEMDTLDAALVNTADRNRGSAWLLGGESGVGKSRIVDELRTSALVRGMTVLRGTAIAEGSQPYELWLGVLRTLCTQTPLTDVQASVLLDVVHDLPKLLDRPVTAAPELSPHLTQARLYAGVEDLLRRQARPALVILEDMHWAGADSVAMMAALHQVIAELPIMVVGSYRNDERADLPRTLPFMQVIALQRLGEGAIAELARAMLGSEAAHPALARFLHEQTEGNVFFLVEMIRKLADELESNAAGRMDMNALAQHVLTGGIRNVVQRRLAQVGAAAMEPLRAAAIMGRNIDLRALAQQYPQLNLQEWLTDCGAAAVLGAHDAQWRFSHDKLREVLLESLDASDATRLHQNAALALEAVYAPDTGKHASRLAHHWHRAGQAPRALPYYQQAAHTAKQVNAYVEARAHHFAILDLLGNMPATAQNSRLQVDTILQHAAIAWASESPELARQRMVHAQALLDSLQQGGTCSPEDLHRQARVLFHRGRLYYAQNNFAEAMRHYERAIELAHDIGDEELFTLASLATGAALILSGHFERGTAVLTPVVDLVEKHAGLVEHIRAMGCLSWGLAAAGRVAQGLQTTAAQVPRAAALNHPTAMAFSHTYSPMVHFLAGDYASAEYEAHLMHDAAVRAAEPILVFLSETFLSWAAVRGGRLEEARAASQRAALVRESLGGKVLLNDWAELALIDITLQDKRYDTALQQIERLADSAMRRDVPFVQGIVLRQWGVAIIAAQGDTEVAFKHFEASQERLQRAGARRELALTWVSWAAALRAAGQQQEAAALQQRAETSLA